MTFGFGTYPLGFDISNGAGYEKRSGETCYLHLQDLETGWTLTLKWYEFSRSEKPSIFFTIHAIFILSIWATQVKLPSDSTKKKNIYMCMYIYIYIYVSHVAQSV